MKKTKKICNKEKQDGNGEESRSGELKQSLMPPTIKRNERLRAFAHELRDYETLRDHSSGTTSQNMTIKPPL